MKVLGLDTATLRSGIAIVDGDGRVLVDARHDASGRNSDLLVAIDAACRDAGVSPRELDAIAIGAGPGSFTGLRIGMATAKGIAFAANRPLWAVSSLAALAYDAETELANELLLAHIDHNSASPSGEAARPGAAGPFDGVIVAALDARRGEVFAGCYRHGALIGVERVMAPAELIPWATALAGELPLSFAGDAFEAHPATFAPLADTWLRTITTPSGTAVATRALAGARVDVLTSGAPTYIRASEAEIMYPDGVPGALRKS